MSFLLAPFAPVINRSTWIFHLISYSDIAIFSGTLALDLISSNAINPSNLFSYPYCSIYVGCMPVISSSRKLWPQIVGFILKFLDLSIRLSIFTKHI